MYHYIRDATGYNDFRVESGQYISDTILIDPSIRKEDHCIISINDKIFELLGTIYDESVHDIIGFFGLATDQLLFCKTNDPLIKCKKATDDKWRTINIMINPPKRPKNGKHLYEITIYYMTIKKIDII